MEKLRRATNIDHVERVVGEITLLYFSPSYVKPGGSVDIQLESRGIADRTEVSVRVAAEDDPENVELVVLTGNISDNKCKLTFSPLEGSTDEAQLREKLGPNMFRLFKATATISSLNLTFAGEESRLAFGQVGVIIESADERFAPKHEDPQIRFRFFDPDNEIKGAVLNIYASNYENKNHPDKDARIFSSPIGSKLRIHDKSREIKWLGQTTTEKGPLKKGKKPVFVNPLFSPYIIEIKFSTTQTDPDQDNQAKVNCPRLLPGGATGQWMFKVEYDSIMMELGDFVPPDKIPDRSSEETKWIQWRLNTLGYPCGPVDGVLGDMTKRAIKSFQRANWEVPWPKKSKAPRIPLVADGIVGPKTMATLRSSQVEKRQLLSVPKDLFDATKDVELYHWANMYYQYVTDVEDGEKEWDSSNRNEFWDSSHNPRRLPRHEKEKKIFNRPWLPLRGKILVKDRLGRGVFVPEAVGEVRVDFTVMDPNEDLDRLVYAPVKKFTDKAIKDADPSTGDNCPEAYAGVRLTDSAKNYKACLQIGKLLEPYEARDDAAHQRIYVQAATEGKARGTVGIYFTPSYQAGDSYRIRAQLNFDDHPNKANLEAGGPIFSESARITNWRKLKVAAFIKYGKRQQPPSDDKALLDAINLGLAAYDYAYLKIEPPPKISKITEYVSSKEYKKLVIDKYGFTTSAEKNQVRFLSTSIYYRNFRPQAAGEDPADYRRYIRTEVNDCMDKISEPLGQLIVNKVRKFVREGLVIIDFNSHEPVTLKRQDGTELPDKYMTSSYAVGLPNGLVYLDIQLLEKDEMDFAYLLAHEIGHTCFLYHWENTWDHNNNLAVPANYEDERNFRDNDGDHDNADNDCIMSYPLDFYNFPAPPANLNLPGAAAPLNSKADYVNYVDTVQPGGQDHKRKHQLARMCFPHFCAKCLLKLRGWDVESLPKKYP